MGYSEIFDENSKLIPALPEDRIPKKLVVGEKYHISWASDHKMVWVLKSWNSVYAFMETPKTKKSLSTKISDLREINKNVRKNQLKRLENYKKNKL